MAEAKKDGDKDDSNGLDGCVCFFIYYMMYPFAAVVRGWSICWLWHWFAAPLTGYASPSVLTCTGLAMLVAAIKGFQYQDKSAKPYDAVVYLIGTAITYTAMAFFGYVFHNLM